MTHMRFALRFIGSCLHVLLAAAISPLLGAPGNTRFTAFQSALITWLMRAQLRLLGVRIQVRGSPHPDAPLLVSNHISWLDILVLGSLRTSCFLSKAEVRNWFLFGGIASHFGTIFITRGDGAGAACEAIAKRLQSNISTVVFPEGTTSNGALVKAFFPRLFAAAIDTGNMVQPVAIHYPAANGVNPLVPFVREQSVFAHAAAILRCKNTDVRVSFAEPVAAAKRGRRELADACREAILAQLPPEVARQSRAQNV